VLKSGLGAKVRKKVPGCCRFRKGELGLFIVFGFIVSSSLIVFGLFIEIEEPCFVLGRHDALCGTWCQRKAKVPHVRHRGYTRTYDIMRPFLNF